MQEERIMLQRVRRKLTAALLVVACALAAFPAQAQAAGSSMKSLNVSWDLKKSGTVTYKTAYAGIGMKKQKAALKDYRISNSATAGYKELTFTASYTLKWNMTAKEVHSAVNSSYAKKNKGAIGGDRWYTVVDYNTGTNLEGKNSYGVSVKRLTGWKYTKPKYYKDDDGCSAWLSNASIKVKVTYPADYKGLCIGVGGSTKLGGTKNDTKYWEGKVKFGKTSYLSSKDKSVAHFMRVTK